MTFNDDLPYRVSFIWKRSETLRELNYWCTVNCTGKFQYQYTTAFFHFENSQDAMMFKFETLK